MEIKEKDFASTQAIKNLEDKFEFHFLNDRPIVFFHFVDNVKKQLIKLMSVGNCNHQAIRDFLKMCEGHERFVNYQVIGDIHNNKENRLV